MANKSFFSDFEIYTDNSKRSKNQLLLIFILYEHRWTELRKLIVAFWLTLVSQLIGLTNSSIQQVILMVKRATWLGAYWF